MIPTLENDIHTEAPSDAPAPEQRFYAVKFRRHDRPYFATSRSPDLQPNELVMVETDKGLEPAFVAQGALTLPEPSAISSHSLVIARKATDEEIERFEALIAEERHGFELCQKYVAKHQLVMKLVKVERFFDGSKIIFYFTAENRVDFRSLVRDLVREFKTRVEMRQIGVRHEAKMTGGLGCCGRELCCSSFLTSFVPVSIRMAKEQDLPLNPAKISGCCNRLLCCLTYEHDTYASVRKQMPKVGKRFTLNGQSYRVVQHNVLRATVIAVDPDDKQIELTRDQWEKAKLDK